LRSFQLSFQCFDVAMQCFEEIFLDIKKELVKHIECNDVLVEYG